MSGKFFERSNIYVDLTLAYHWIHYDHVWNLFSSSITQHVCKAKRCVHHNRNDIPIKSRNIKQELEANQKNHWYWHCLSILTHTHYFCHNNNNNSNTIENSIFPKQESEKKYFTYVIKSKTERCELVDSWYMSQCMFGTFLWRPKTWLFSISMLFFLVFLKVVFFSFLFIH